MDPAAPDRVLGGRYRLIRHLARGGMASVWLGEDTLLARRVAVKVLHAELSTDESLRIRFRNEAISSASIASAGIVAIYDTGDDDGVAYIVMEYVDGQDLRRVLDDRGPLDPAEAVRIARAVALALDHAHRNGIVHRDIKPANVLVAVDGRVKVTDFGIAKARRSGSDLTSTGTILGTARYLAPEQVRGDPADERADIYATGLLLYEMVAGHPPFGGDTDLAAALARLSTRPAPLPPGLPRGVVTVVGRCLALEPDDRYPNAPALARALDGADDTDPTAPQEVTGTLVRPRGPEPALSAPPPVPRQPRRGRWVALVVALLLVVGGGGAYLALRDQAGPSSGGGTAAPSVVAAKDYDPLGDRQEQPRLAPLAIDNDLKTAWSTETYVTRDLGGGKPGVGIYVTLTRPATVHAVTVDTFQTDWNGAIFTAPTVPPQFSGWGKPKATRAHLGTHTVFTLTSGSTAGVVLLWITYLPVGGQLQVAEIHVR